MSIADALARFNCLCIDATDTAALGSFWAQVLDRRWEPSERGDDDRLAGPTPGHTIWINPVPERLQVKQRVHLDIYTRSLADLLALNSSVERPQGEDLRWTVMLDPEGGQYCASVRDELPAERLNGLVVDSADPAAIAAWWAQVWGGELTHNKRGFSTISNVPGMPIETCYFVPIPEPKTVKNRIHWDITGDRQTLLAIGATMLRRRDSDIHHDVMADPEGNEFCVMT